MEVVATFDLKGSKVSRKITGVEIETFDDLTKNTIYKD